MNFYVPYLLRMRDMISIQIIQISISLKYFEICKKFAEILFTEEERR